jgi:transcriptional regulator with XRE-family HTH domain
MKSKISSLLYKLMRQHGISQAALSRATGVAQPTINRILCEVTLNPRHDSMERLANFFDVTPDSMYGRPPKETRGNTLDELYEKIMCLSDIERSALFIKTEKNSLIRKTAQSFTLINPII